MKCDKCGEEIGRGDERGLRGQTLCDDCCMDALSPTRTCDPWAVHAAKSFSKEDAEGKLNPIQSKILKILKETGGIERASLSDRLNIRPADLEREIAALRHMEKVRGELREGKKAFLVLW